MHMPGQVYDTSETVSVMCRRQHTNDLAEQRTQNTVASGGSKFLKTKVKLVGSS